jgi:lipopolysaccharide transport system ATP-binding protein
MADISIRVQDLGKLYHIGKTQDKYRTLRDTLVDGLTAPFRRAGKLLRGQASGASELDDTIWALKDVSFEIKPGEAVGIIGRNGAGKSTLLKVLSRITEPTTGSADIYGRVGSLLEVGTGFHPELTGRENVYLNGVILGMRRSEIDQRFDEIVSFAEVAKFIDTPVKHYSSGMRLRLGFAVAAHLEPEILLIDEVLAVGDAAFQKKCLGTMKNVANRGRTVLFVSHDMGAITELCQWTVWLEKGRVELIGPSSDVVASYLSSHSQGKAVWRNALPVPSDQEVGFRSVRLLSADDRPTAVVRFDSPFKVEVAYDVVAPIRDLSVAYHLFDSRGRLLFESIDTDMPEHKGITREVGSYLAVCSVPAQLLMPGRYYISVAAFVERVKFIEQHESVIAFDISKAGYSLNPGRFGVVSPVLEWTVDRREEASSMLLPAVENAR